MSKQLAILAMITGALLYANLSVLRDLKEVDYQCTSDGVVNHRSKLLVTEVNSNRSYTIHRAGDVTTYRLPINCTFTTKPTRYIAEVWRTNR